MKHPNQSRSKTQIIRPGIFVGLAVLFSITFLGVSTITAQPSTLVSETELISSSVLRNGNVITIGVGAAQSLLPDMAWPQVNAAQLAIDQVNAAGGINIAGTDHTLALAIADDGCNASQGAEAAETLINAGAAAVVGYTCSSASKAAQPIHASAGVPMISPSSTSDDLTEQGYTTTFRVISRDSAPGVLLVTYLREWLKLEKAAIVEIDGFWGNPVTDTLSETFTSLGGTVTSRRMVASAEEFVDALTAIKAEGPNVIFYSDTDANNAGLLSHEAYRLGMTDTIIAWFPFSEDEALLTAYAAQAGPAAEGDYAAMPNRRIQDMPGYETFNTAYQAAEFPNNGDEAGIWGAYAYDATNIIIAAIKSAQSTDPDDIRDAIASTTNYNGVVGKYNEFDAKGDVIPQWAWLEKYANGQWLMLDPGRLFLPIILSGFGQ